MKTVDGIFVSLSTVYKMYAKIITNTIPELVLKNMLI